VDGVTVGVVVWVFMGASSLAVAVAFHAMRGMYLHAERLLAKAGRQGARGGVYPPERSGGGRKAGLHKRSAEDWGCPLRRARAAPSARFGFLIGARKRT
jgi:hypothetical protein